MPRIVARQSGERPWFDAGELRVGGQNLQCARTDAQGGQCHDEVVDLQSGDNGTVDETDEHASAHADQDPYQQRQAVLQTEQRRGRTQTHDRPHRQVDAADHEHTGHPRCDEDDRHRLDEQVPQAARGQEDR